MRKPSAILLAAVVSLTLLAGCSDDPAGPTVPPVVLDDAAGAFAAGNASANLQRLGGLAVGGAEIDACDHYLYTDSGDHVDIVDASDPANLVVLAAIPTPADIQDVKVSDDCQWLFVGNDEEGSIPPVHDLGLPAGAPVGEGGFYTWDISDPLAPVAKGSLGVGPRRGPHMVYYHNTTDGQELVLGANADISINAFDRATGQLTELSRYQADLVFAFNRDPYVIDALYQGWAHDMVVMEDPIDNKTLMYVANWDAGLRIVDLSDPSNPVELGGWNAFPQGDSGNLHTVATQWIGDKRITVGSVEVGFAVVGGIPYALHTERGVLYVWDTTDPANIQLLATWENPNGEPIDRDMIEGVESSTHNLQLEEGRVYMAHYNKGVFVLDVSTPETQAAPKLLAFHKEPEDTVWDVLLNDGILYSSGSVGLVALHFTPDVVGAAGIDSRA